MKFRVIDNNTGKDADAYEIALHEEWAQCLVYCDMEGFFISEDGQLILADECGNFVYCDPERFKVVFEDERPHGTWEEIGFQNGYAFCRCLNCHKTMKLYLDSKNEFCCIADIRNKVVSCMYCGSDNRKMGETENET